MRLRRRSSGVKQSIGFASAMNLFEAQKQAASSSPLSIPQAGPELELVPSAPFQPLPESSGSGSGAISNGTVPTSMGGGSNDPAPSTSLCPTTAPTGVLHANAKERTRSFAVKLREGFNPSSLLGLKSKVSARQLMAAESASVYSSAATRCALYT